MSDASKRDLKRDVAKLKQRSDSPSTVVFKTEDERYVDKEGEPTTDFSNVVFVVPPEVWKLWEESDRDLAINVPKE